MTKKTQLLFVWLLVPGLVVGLFALVVVAHYIPPHWPSWTADVVASIYADHQTAILIGMVASQLTTALMLPFWVMIYLQMRRIEGTRAPALSLVYLTSSICANIVAGFLPGMFFITAAFRPERNPEITQIFNDIGWFYFTFPVGGLGLIMLVVMAVCFLADKSAQPLFPRWVGFMNIWLAVLALPAALVPFFMKGPFAWNGILAFWLPLSAFGGWLVIMVIHMLKAIKRDDYAPVYT